MRTSTALQDCNEALEMEARGFNTLTDENAQQELD
jgi:hypothetical protein